MSITWEGYWSRVGNEDLLAARELLEVSPRVRAWFAHFIKDDDTDDRPWDRAAAALPQAPLSSTERALAELVVALAANETYPLHFRRLDTFGEWELDVWRILTEWATDGRCTVTASRR